MKKEDQLLESSYDGIQEYDNSMPGWLRAIFYLSIVFAFVYCGYYLLGSGIGSKEAFELSMKEHEKIIAKAEASNKSEAKDDTVSLASLVQDKAKQKAGSEVFTQKCASCHGNLGEGLIGPNLTDKYWIHGGKVEDIKKTIEVGVLDKGMLAWKGVLTDDEIVSVTAFITSISGTNPKNAKEPQGELFDESK